jgi:hypothetical protein
MLTDIRRTTEMLRCLRPAALRPPPPPPRLGRLALAPRWALSMSSCSSPKQSGSAAKCSSQGAKDVSSSSCGSSDGTGTSSSACPSAAAAPALVHTSLAFWTERDVWRRAGLNTTRCLIGCSMGDLSMLFLLQAYAPGVGVVAATAASCAAGITTSMALETVVLRATEDLSWTTAWRTAAGMSLISMSSMELAENATELYLCGGNVAVSGAAFWQALPLALAAGFFTPLPYNYYMLRKYGRGCH